MSAREYICLIYAACVQYQNERKFVRKKLYSSGYVMYCTHAVDPQPQSADYYT